MGLSHLDHQAFKSSPEMSSDSSTSSDSYDTSDILEDPMLHPRVGDEYQAEVPPILSNSELLQLKINPADSSHSFLMGLAIPVVWEYDHANSRKNESFEFENGNFAFPGLSTETWSDFEVDCFLLGLYIFGKNLLQVKKFMESKDMGQILSYYYGQFHGSGAYHKWSECRKMTIRKCVVGERFFTGCRQHKLLSRLLPRLSEESKTKLLEASGAFSEGITSLDEYVFLLKTLVGTRVLVEVVAIGKGKEDLTTLVVDSKNTQIFTQKNFHSRKSCSSLTLAEIVKYLTGDIRLSKARSSDLFWEAVWPRLLERGWRSEDPGIDVYGSSKNGLVFLMPGITEFSRRKLIKGEDYFDSVTDILAKVASEPELIELEIDETLNKPGGFLEEVNSDTGNNSSNHQEHHCNYLRPHVSEELSKLSKITVVDTSLASAENPSKTRELRSLPLVNAKRSSNLSNQLRKAGKDPKTKRRRIDSYGKGIITFVLGLPAIDKNAIMKKNAVHPKANQKNVKAEIAFSDGNILKSKLDEENVVVRKNAVPSEVNQQSVKAKVVSSDGKIVEDKIDEKNVVVRTNVVPSEVNQENVKRKVASSYGKIVEDKIDEKNVVVRMNVVPFEVNRENVKAKVASFDGKIVEDKMDDRNAVVGKNVIPSKVNPKNMKVKLKVKVVSSDGKIPEDKMNDKNAEVRKNVKVKVKVASSDGKILGDKMDQKNANFSSENGKIPDLNLPQVPTENGIDHAKVVSEEVKNNPSDTKDARVSSSGVKPNRRHSTRNRPLTTKALEALEIDFLNPVRQSRKRSSSLTDDQKHSKRSYGSQNNDSFVFSDIAGFQERAAA